ncbi:hypothetical protein EG68_05741 [Paragonimus skrjabini miyazakii]|uniref:CUB domain-containing protein n=1 Tax=Paragonimus skrjabini miyazakii TaxID=59628 RepID=A0A8S9Z1F4_9TREM|nr:hypothetical protein EG68_05741 [Paragonimus skrjabini miyazakii]
MKHQLIWWMCCVGFMLLCSPYSSEQCGSKLTGEQGEFTSPNYPNDYPPNARCSWLISVPENQRIELRFLDFESNI